MKRRGIKGLAIGLAVMVLGSLTAMADPSITKNGTVSQEFTINGESADTTKYRATFEVPLEETVASADVLDTIDRINAEPAQLSEILEEAQVSEEDAAILGSFQLLTQIQDLSIIDQSTGQPVEGLTNVTLTWEVPNLTSEMKNIRVLHYSTVRNVWEILNPDKVDFENKAITQTFQDLSPVAVLYTLDGDGTVTSPGTGDSTPVVYYAAAAMVAFGVCITVVLRKKVRN